MDSNYIKISHKLKLDNPITGYLHLANVTVNLYGKIPNRFQRFMLKKILGLDIKKTGDEND